MGLTTVSNRSIIQPCRSPCMSYSRANNRMRRKNEVQAQIRIATAHFLIPVGFMNAGAATVPSELCAEEWHISVQVFVVRL